MSSLKGKSSEEMTNTADNFNVLPWDIPPEISTPARAVTPASVTTTWKKQGCAGPQVLDTMLHSASQTQTSDVPNTVMVFKATPVRPATTI